MKFRTVSISASALLLIITPLLIAKPASAEKIMAETSAVIFTQGPVTSSMYFQKAFVKRQAAFIRRDPLAVPISLCDDLGLDIPKVICKLLAKRTDRILSAADANQCLKVRTPGSTMLTLVTLPLSAVTLDTSKYCK